MDAMRPYTASRANDDGASSSSRRTDNSMTGSQINALIQQRSALRAQLSMVEQQLKEYPASSSGLPTRGASRGPLAVMAPSLDGPLRAKINPVPPREPPGSHKLLQQKSGALRSPAAAGPLGGEPALPGAMQPGRYAFWPKRLPGAASRRPAAPRTTIR